MTHESSPSGPPLFPHDQFVNNTERVLSEIKRILYWEHHAEIQKRKDNVFTAFNQTTVASGGGTANLHIKNASNSGFSVAIEGINVSSQFRGGYEIFDSFTSAPSGGEGNGVDSLLMDKDATGASPNTTINADVSFTADNTHFAEVLPSGGAGVNTRGGALEATKPIIEPGREIVIELTNNSTDTNNGSIAVTWVEEEEIYSE